MTAADDDGGWRLDFSLMAMAAGAAAAVAEDDNMLYFLSAAAVIDTITYFT